MDGGWGVAVGTEPIPVCGEGIGGLFGAPFLVAWLRERAALLVAEAVAQGCLPAALPHLRPFLPLHAVQRTWAWSWWGSACWASPARRAAWHQTPTSEVGGPRALCSSSCMLAAGPGQPTTCYPTAQALQNTGFSQQMRLAAPLPPSCCVGRAHNRSRHGGSQRVARLAGPGAADRHHGLRHSHFRGRGLRSCLPAHAGLGVRPGSVEA